MANIGFPLFLAAVPILGYMVLYVAYVTRFRYCRVAGQRQFFAASVAGILLLVLGRLASSSYSAFHGDICFEYCANWLPDPQHLKDLVHQFAPFAGSDALFWSLGAGFLLALTANLVMGRTRSAISAAEWYGDLIEMRLQSCMRVSTESGKQEDKLAEVSLRSGKSCIGFVLNSGVASIGDTVIAILPVASGYCNVETQRLIINNDYGNLVEISE